MSSANSIDIDLLFLVIGRSFIYMRKSKGPKTEPGGTPCLTVAQFDTLLHIPISFYNAAR
jgi:hypothetical protein